MYQDMLYIAHLKSITITCYLLLGQIIKNVQPIIVTNQIIVTTENTFTGFCLSFICSF